MCNKVQLNLQIMSLLTFHSSQMYSITLLTQAAHSLPFSCREGLLGIRRDNSSLNFCQPLLTLATKLPSAPPLAPTSLSCSRTH